eukprot:CAMPEP_0174346594 /NCGR_PEP_ID=MMETSP0811_2-20130205/2322_1 /TAXON_ID=73025 ORGANISM="Eutreptiella gymnastica-like, Strain CCMP1594" /NCGR_SAMPLE_ID=MMETSP0811_2 /ASSEMBLY_ACC=CAM_ASM_000667 /LENGTH=182 /DNA_ID=CAMNT_0015471277 /DNA_START=512 /DNA_END=1058 /DNA_ORIENTATION=-
MRKICGNPAMHTRVGYGRAGAGVDAHPSASRSKSAAATTHTAQLTANEDALQSSQTFRCGVDRNTEYPLLSNFASSKGDTQEADSRTRGQESVDSVRCSPLDNKDLAQKPSTQSVCYGQRDSAGLDCGPFVVHACIGWQLSSRLCISKLTPQMLDEEEMQKGCHCPEEPALSPGNGRGTGSG